MNRSPYEHAILAIATKRLLDTGNVAPGVPQELQDTLAEYGSILIALKELVRNIQEQSNIGDELCKDLLHETLIPNLPSWAYPLFGFDL